MASAVNERAGAVARASRVSSSMIFGRRTCRAPTVVRRHGPWRTAEHLELATLDWVDWLVQPPPTALLVRTHPTSRVRANYYTQHQPPAEDAGMQES